MFSKKRKILSEIRLPTEGEHITCSSQNHREKSPWARLSLTHEYLAHQPLKLKQESSLGWKNTMLVKLE